MEGYRTLEEHAQEYIELFLALQQDMKQDGQAGQRIDRQLQSIAEREHVTEIFLPAGYLKACFGLTDAEYFLVMFAFCCEVEGGLCLQAGEGLHGNRISLQYALHLISGVFAVDFELIAGFVREKNIFGDLFDINYGNYEEGWNEKAGSLLQPLFLNRIVFYFLLTGTLPGEEWYTLLLAGEEQVSVSRRQECDIALESGVLYGEAYERLCSCLEGARPQRIILHGHPGSGKHELLRRVCRKKKLDAIFVKLSQLYSQSECQRNRALQSLRVICRLMNPVVILEGAEELPGNTREPEHWGRPEFRLPEGLSGWLSESTGMRSAADFDRWTLIVLAESWETADMLEKYADLRVDLEVSADGQGSGVAGRSKRGGGSGLGRLIESRFSPEDMVLPEECRRQMETVIRLAGSWESGQGLHLLFYGSSGTGKTMAASVLAGRLGHPLFKVDLSRIYDKYIGETEKHMDEIFRTAKRCNYMLFFDEADSLFAKRTGIKDSHDRYANVSTAYLLQRIEEYDGILVLATNLMDHFDDAFVRRIRFIIRFRNLDEKDRERLWEKALAGSSPVAQDVSFQRLARAVELSPARIQAAAQVAKLLAACEESGTVTKRHLKEALELEAGKDDTAVGMF